jgi:uncharacterized membrane protein YjgN (DUF898 family)
MKNAMPIIVFAFFLGLVVALAWLLQRGLP